MLEIQRDPSVFKSVAFIYFTDTKIPILQHFCKYKSHLFCWEKSTVYFQSVQKRNAQAKRFTRKTHKKIRKNFFQQILIVIKIEQCKKLKIPNAH